MRLNTKTTKNITSNTKKGAVIAMALVAGATMALAFFAAITSTVQEVQAQGPPAKAQAILAAEPSQRGEVASVGAGGKPCSAC
jgi:formate/nitrite transporter FocA (FNT family)